MEPTMVYIVAVLNGITLVSPEAIPQDKCEGLRKYNQSLIWMCVEEDVCGRSPGLTRCKDDPLPRKRYARKR